MYNALHHVKIVIIITQKLTYLRLLLYAAASWIVIIQYTRTGHALYSSVNEKHNSYQSDNMQY